jgi:hypothetical protein
MISPKTKAHFDAHPDQLQELFKDYQYDLQQAKNTINGFLFARNRESERMRLFLVAGESSFRMVQPMTPKPHQEELWEYVGSWLASQRWWLENEIAELLAAWPHLAGSAGGPAVTPAEKSDRETAPEGP